MIKIFTLLNLAGYFLFELLFAAGIGVTQDLPTSIAPGTEVKVVVTLDKADVIGFAKLQIDLPKGLTASAIETRGASFTFADGKAKFIWMALPTQAQFKVSYTLSAASNANGTLPITGRLSYIEGNERKTVDMPSSTINVGNGAFAGAPTITNDATTTDLPATASTSTITTSSTIASPSTITTTATVANTPADLAITANSMSSVASQDPGEISARRTITRVSTDEVLVEVRIQKQGLRGFGKLQENIPQGFTAIAQGTQGSIFTAQGTVAKFIWLNLPPENELVITYQLLASGKPTGEYTVTGDFGFLRNDLSQRVAVGTSTFFTGTETMQARETKMDTEQKVAAVPATPKVMPTPDKQPVQETVTAHTTRAKVANIPAPEVGITYKVQITAAHREVGHPYFIQRHHFSGDFMIEHHEGWIKYVTGRFDAYQAARQLRQNYITAGNNFPGPFVTAYNNGERITVQEALMIARQRSAQ